MNINSCIVSILSDTDIHFYYVEGKESTLGYYKWGSGSYYGLTNLYTSTDKNYIYYNKNTIKKHNSVKYDTDPDPHKNSYAMKVGSITYGFDTVQAEEISEFPF